MTSLRSVPGLRPLLASEIASSFALAVQALAVPWLVLTRGGSPTQVGVVMTAELTSAIVFGIPFGGLVQRVGARRWMIGSDLASAALVTTIGVLAATGRLPFWALVALVFALGALRTPYMGSQQELLSSLTGDGGELLARATSILQGANRTALLLGAPLAGVLVTRIGPVTTLFVTVVALLVVIGIITSAVPARASQPEQEESRPRMLDGLRELRSDRLVTWWVSGSAISEAAYQALFVAIPVLTVFRYHATAAAAGALTGAFGGGAVAGSLAASWITTRVAPLRVAMTGKLLQGVFFAVLIVGLPLWGAAVAMALLGAANGLANGPVAAVEIPRLDPRRRGNALTVSATIIMSGGALGSAAAGPALDHLSPDLLFAGGAVLLAASCLFFIHGARTTNGTDPSPRKTPGRTPNHVP